MWTRFRGIVVRPDDHSVLIHGDRGIIGFATYAPTDVRVGEWAEVSGGGFSGMFGVRRLAVFA